VRWLESHLGGQWQCLASQYEALHGDVAKIRDSLAVLKSAKSSLVAEIRKAAETRVEAERAKGRHWREKIFERQPTEDDWSERARLTRDADDAARRLASLKAEWKRLQAEQDALVTGPEAAKGRQRRTDIAFEAELARVRLVREAVIATDGLDKAGHRPSAWWFPLVCPNGSWYRATMSKATYRLESLI
jgi:predicted  nucleic acid-binding Zn-ribbon protein